MGEKKYEGAGIANGANRASLPSRLPTLNQSTLSDSRHIPTWDSSFFARFCDAGIKGRAIGATGI